MIITYSGNPKNGGTVTIGAAATAAAPVHGNSNSVKCQGVVIYPNTGSGTLYWGGSGVTASTGIPIDADGTFVGVDDLNKLYIKATSDGDNYRYVYFA